MTPPTTPWFPSLVGWPSSAFCWDCRGLRLQVCWGVLIYKSREKGSLAVGSQASQSHLYSCSPLCSFPSTGTFQFTRSICWLRYDLLSFQKANSGVAGHWRKVLLTVHALAELVFKDFWDPAALSWPPVGTHTVQLEKSTESGAQGWGWGGVSLSLCSPGLSAWGYWAVLFYHHCDKGPPPCPSSALRGLSGVTWVHAL